ncbi:MAG: PilZ domain-containing protein [Aquificaceae bacterium]
MTFSDILTALSKKKECELITSWKEIPVKLKLPIKWISSKERLISFNFKECRFKSVFSGTDPVYIKFNEIFLSCRIFSNVRDELVLEIESTVPAPHIALREYIRVQPKETEPVYVSFCVGDNCILKARVINISESGVGILIYEKDANKLLEILSDISTDVQKIHTIFDIYLELPHEDNIKTVGELRNIIKENDYIRIGLKMDLDEKDRTKVRRYIMQRQREILEQLKSI